MKSIFLNNLSLVSVRSALLFIQLKMNSNPKPLLNSPIILFTLKLDLRPGRWRQHCWDPNLNQLRSNSAVLHYCVSLIKAMEEKVLLCGGQNSNDLRGIGIPCLHALGDISHNVAKRPCQVRVAISHSSRTIRILRFYVALIL